MINTKSVIMMLFIFAGLVSHAALVVDLDFESHALDEVLGTDVSKYDYTSDQVFVEGTNVANNTLAFRHGSQTDYHIKSQLGHGKVLYVTGADTLSNTDRGSYLLKMDFTDGSTNADIRVSWSFDILGFDNDADFDGSNWTVIVNTGNNSQNINVSDSWFNVGVNSVLGQTFDVSTTSWTTITGSVDIANGTAGTRGGIQISGTSGGWISANKGLYSLDNILVDVSPIPGTENFPPAFLADPVSGPDATEYVPYSGTISGTASDPEGDPLVYTKTGGPAWLHIGADGLLSGAPGGGNPGVNHFTVQVADDHGGLDTALLEIMVTAGSSRVAFQDDFSTGSGTLGTINGWTEQGPESKNYNVSGSGMLVVQDDNGNEKGNGAHAGYFDNLYADLGGSVSLPNVGDWIQLSVDFDVFTGSYGGATVADDTAGLRISLTESGLSTNAGFGIYIGTGTATSHSYEEMKGAASSQATINSALTGVDIPEDSALKNVTLLFTRVESGVVLSGSLAGNALMTATNSNAAIMDNLFNRLTFSVASRDHGLMIDNVAVTVPATSSLWNQYVVAKGNGTEPILPDFSFAGYRHGQEPVPTVAWPVFDVTHYGAAPDDGLSDKAAIQAAIAAAEANGSGIIFFPPGRFEINKPETPWVNDIIYVEGSRIVFRGSGRGAGGTELYGERHMNPTNPENLWTCPKMIQFKGYGDRTSTQSAVTADSSRETFSVTVADGSKFGAGLWIQLTRDDNFPAAVAEAVAPYTVDPAWTSIINDGVQVRELHQIVEISGNLITFKEPIHSDVTSSGNWSVVLYDPLEEVGVEDIAFTGGWVSNFVHHASYFDDSGWSALSFGNVVNSWIRNCRFTDWSACVSVGGSANVTVSDLKLDGNKGHNALTFNNSSHCLAFNIDDTAGHHHACGVAGRCSGNVFHKCDYSDDTCYESHASQPRCTLFDNITGGWKYGRWGGAVQNQPNHLRHLVFWNYENIGAGEPGQFEFMRSGSVYGRIIMPYVVGFHGNPQAFDTSMIEVLESNGSAVKPDSLYEAQYQLRTGKTFPQLQFGEWAGGHGLSGAESEAAADPDADYRDNLFEYAVGGIPTPGTNCPCELPRFGIIYDGGFQSLEYVYQRRRNADKLGLAYSVEVNADLMTNNWSGIGVIETGSALINDGFETVTNRVPMVGATNNFMRLRINMD